MLNKNKMKKGLLLAFAFVALPGFAQVTTFDYVGASQSYTVPAGVTLIQIEVAGGQGGSGDGGAGGFGATMIGTFEVAPGDVLDVVVGGAGMQFGNSGGGGGGTGVVFESIPLILAGGGGGAAYNAVGFGGLITEEGGASSGVGGVAGYGGGKGYMVGDCGWAGGGGGFYGDGYGGTIDWDGGPAPGVLAGDGAGMSWLSGGAGGIDGGCSFVVNAGAFGCGAGGAGEYGGAGGGGYAGGGGGQYIDPDPLHHGGGGGGSYNDGTDQVNTAGNHSGNGVAIITVLCGSPIIEFTAELESFGADASIDLTITGGDGTYVFDWDNDGTGDFDDTEDLTGISAGIYHVVVDDESGCPAAEATIVVDSQVGIEVENEVSIQLYPNPAVSYFELKTEGDFSIVVYNSVGELILVKKGVNFTSISCSEWSKGLYSLEISTENGTSIRKLIIQ